MPSYQLNSQNTILLPEFQQWADQYGMITDMIDGGSSGNGILFTSHYVWGLMAKGLMTDQERARLIQVFRGNFVQPGLMVRAPSKLGDYEAHDDYIGAMSAGMFLGQPFAKEFLDYGKNTVCLDFDDNDNPSENLLNGRIYALLKILKLGKVKWCWNNKHPGLFHEAGWFGRRLEVTGTMKMASGARICPILWLYWAGCMMALTKNSPNDAYILRTHMALACENYGFLTKLVCKYVRNKVKSQYGDFGKLLSAYFNRPDHPLVKLLEGIS